MQNAMRTGVFSLDTVLDQPFVANCVGLILPKAKTVKVRMLDDRATWRKLK